MIRADSYQHYATWVQARTASRMASDRLDAVVLGLLAESFEQIVIHADGDHGAGSR
jgi:hypothetical protein